MAETEFESYRPILSTAKKDIEAKQFLLQALSRQIRWFCTSKLDDDALAIAESMPNHTTWVMSTITIDLIIRIGLLFLL